MNINRVIVGGRLTRDPELRHVGQNGTAVCEIGLAVDEHRKGQEKPTTHFIDIVCWGRTAEVVNEFCRKGAPLLVEGRLTQDRWKDRDTGKQRSKLKVTADHVHFSPKANGNGKPGSHDNGTVNEPEPESVPF